MIHKLNTLDYKHETNYSKSQKPFHISNPGRRDDEVFTRRTHNINGQFAAIIIKSWR